MRQYFTYRPFYDPQRDKSIFPTQKIIDKMALGLTNTTVVFDILRKKSGDGRSLGLVDIDPTGLTAPEETDRINVIKEILTVYAWHDKTPATARDFVEYCMGRVQDDDDGTFWIWEVLDLGISIFAQVNSWVEGSNYTKGNDFYIRIYQA